MHLSTAPGATLATLLEVRGKVGAKPIDKLTLGYLVAMSKIVVENPVVELDGDEMTRIIWKKIREEVSLQRYQRSHKD